MDFIIKLLVSNFYDSIFVIVDCLIKMAYFILCIKSMTSEEIKIDIKLPSIFYLQIDRKLKHVNEVL